MTTRIFVLMPLALLTCSHQAAAQATYTPYTFTTLAGYAGYGSADGTGSAARFYQPSGVAVDSSGIVYVADLLNHTIRRVTLVGTNWVVTTLAGLAGVSGTNDGTVGTARFNYPSGVAVDTNGNVYVADSSNHTIRKVTPTGVVSTLAGLAGSYGTNDGPNSAARFFYPSGVVVDTNGNIYVADSGNHTIRKVTPAGTNWVVSTLAGLAGTFGSAEGTGSVARFYYPRGLTMDTNGNLYVADYYNYTIRKVTPVGTNWVVSTLAGSARDDGNADGTGSTARFNEPNGVAVDGTGNLYVADLANNTIRKVTPTRVVITIAGLAGSAGRADGTNSVARFDYPNDVAVDTDGNVYVADAGNETIRKMVPVGTNWVVTTLAGRAGSVGSTDGTNSDARFNGPYGVAVDGTGNVYVADYFNYTIRKVTPVGTNWVVSTIAGLAGNRGSADGTNSDAQFEFPNGVAVDANGNVYVADLGNNTIRKVTPAGTNWVVTTLAGLAGSYGSTDGTNSTARFSEPNGVAVDGTGNLYVADYFNDAIRKVAPVGTNWVVTTLAGLAGSIGSADGTNKTARFYYPQSVSVDGAGNVYVADTYNYTIRKMVPVGTNWVVTTLAGLAGSVGSADGTGSDARFGNSIYYAGPVGVAVDGAGNVYVADQGNNTIRKGFPATSAPVIVTGSLVFSDGQVSFNLTGPAGQTVVVEVSINLVNNWLPIWTNTFGLGSLPFSDSQSGVFSQRFYRARSP
jgi:sugar lactone lactonase YvrE